MYTYTTLGLNDTQFIIYFPLGIPTNKLLNVIQLYPNPSSGEFQLTSGTSQLLELQVVDVFGRQIIKIKTDHVTIKIDLSDQPAGIYFLRIMDEEKRTFVHKLIKQ